MSNKPKSVLTKKRQTELKREYRTGEAVGRAIIKFFVEEMRNPDSENSQTHETTLTAEEINFLQSIVEENEPNREEFIRYYCYYDIITGQEHWVNYYTQRYYKDFFKILSILQAA